MTIDLDALEKLAGEAEESGGDWECSSEAGSSFIAAAHPATIKDLIAELKEARGLLDDLVCEVFDAITSDGEAQDCKAAELADLVDMARHAHRAFLARNGKGEG
ncbi:hypothetical protein [uncultured Brevundimonas sp.]|uniref:hypothetical protein n=1 Tax=uncultured Brevundimonas sp. TaxID=213418 RepID=UPI0025D1AE5A|nr:hypothetical protein [uncultured Brevundimonas sp.]